MATIGIIQSNFLPWRGYFDFIDSCDKFVILDNVQYTKNDWRNRNRIKTKDGLHWLTVPVNFSFSQATTIEKTPINYSIPWIEEHINIITAAYSNAPYFEHYAEELFSLISKPVDSISQLNVALIRWAMISLKIDTEIVLASKLVTSNEKSHRVLDIVRQLGGTKYLTGPAAKAYLDESIFREAGVAIDYKTYNYPHYPQLFGTFEGSLSIIDLFFNAGPESFHYINELK